MFRGLGEFFPKSGSADAQTLSEFHNFWISVLAQASLPHEQFQRTEADLACMNGLWHHWLSAESVDLLLVVSFF